MNILIRLFEFFSIRSYHSNIRRGLIIRELELTELLKTENLDYMFLTETDTNMITTKDDIKTKLF